LTAPHAVAVPATQTEVFATVACPSPTHLPPTQQPPPLHVVPPQQLSPTSPHGAVHVPAVQVSGTAH
jgi:hypothetical protein